MTGEFGYINFMFLFHFLVILEDMLSQYGRQLSIDLSQPLDRQE